MAVPHAGDILERRLTDIGNSLLTDSEGLGLLALGSVGVETARRDAWSDLDFFAIVQPGSKPRWLADIAWLEAVAPVAWSFENTKDGRKLLFADGVYAEYAVFTPDELAGAAFAEGRWIVRRAELPDGLRVTTNDSGRIRPRADTTWSAGELVSCLYVGLCRFHRGSSYRHGVSSRPFASIDGRNWWNSLSPSRRRSPIRMVATVASKPAGRTRRPCFHGSSGDSKRPRRRRSHTWSGSRRGTSPLQPCHRKSAAWREACTRSSLGCLDFIRYL